MPGAKRFLLGLLIFAAVLVPAHAGEMKHGFVNMVYKGDKGEPKYVLFVPHDYKGDKEYPLILFLHGSGERGDDGQAPVLQGIGNAIKFKGKEKDFPCFVIFPQASSGGSWKAGKPDADLAMVILAETQKNFKIDSQRVYLTGLSMGGMGTWSLAAAYPDKWAAIVPICGGGDTATAEKIKHIPCWCFCGDKDGKYLLDGCRNMVQALKDAGGEPRYSEFPYVGHNSWDSAYVTPELYSWLLKQKLK